MLLFLILTQKYLITNFKVSIIFSGNISLYDQGGTPTFWQVISPSIHIYTYSWENIRGFDTFAGDTINCHWIFLKESDPIFFFSLIFPCRCNIFLSFLHLFFSLSHLYLPLVLFTSLSSCSPFCNLLTIRGSNKL